MMHSAPADERHAGMRAVAAALMISVSLTGAMAQAPPPLPNYVIADLGSRHGITGITAVSRNGTRLVGTAGLPSPRAVLVERGLTVTNLGTLGGNFSGAIDISDNGQFIVGVSESVPNGPRRAFRWNNGTMIDLGLLPGAVRAYANAVNDAGDVVGYMEFSTHGPRGFLWHNGTLTDLGTLGGDTSVANDINNAGVIVGYSQTAVGEPWRAFRRQNGVMQNLGTPGGHDSNSVATAINSAGVIVGYAQFRNNQSDHGFRLMNGSWTDLGNFSGSSSTALDINDEGEIVGTSSDRAWIWRNGTLTDLNTLALDPPLPDGIFLKYAYGISNGPVRSIAGVIGGIGVTGGYMLMGDGDKDAIPDTWEMAGLDADGDGVIDLDFLALGARPDHPDVFVEVDVMAGLAFSPIAESYVENSFRNAPNSLLNNPDGADGINLHIEVSENDIPFAAAWPDTGRIPPEFRSTKADHFGNPDDSVELRDKKRLFYHYCLAINAITDGDTLGMGEVWGNDFFICLGSLANAGGEPHLRQAGSFMHELGHNLGLQHGGDVDVNRKPNYYSVMNYARHYLAQAWLLTPLDIDYSRHDLPDLDESALDETAGIGAPAGAYPYQVIPYRIADGTVRLARLQHGASVDWDGDGAIVANPVSVDVNGSNVGQLLTGYCDWCNLKLRFVDNPRHQNDEGEPELPVDEPSLTEEAWYLANIEPPGVAGDTNCDGTIDNFDIDPFVLALTDPSAYSETFAICGIRSADVDGDGTVTNFDIDPFVACLTSGCP